MQAELIKTFSNVAAAGQYVPTALDARKAAAKVRLVACDSGNTIALQNGAPVPTGRGVKACGSMFLLTDAAWARYSAQFSRDEVVCDF